MSQQVGLDLSPGERPRVVAWFSCGAASAVAAKIVVEKYPEDAVVVYCDTMASEHPDNARFFLDVERWLGRPIQRIASREFATVDEVFERTRYMAGTKGARCTVEMKKVPRFRFQRWNDTHVFGFTKEEMARASRLREENPELNVEFPLIDQGITKSQCLGRLTLAGIELPEMYRLGYRNNNCLGCVKASSARYWNMIRRDFPEVFERRARQSRALGVRLTRVRGDRVFLDELPENYNPGGALENISCGPDCHV